MAQPSVLTDAVVRRWLSMLDHPDRMGRDAALAGVLETLGLVAEPSTPLTLGRAGAQLFNDLVTEMCAAPPVAHREKLTGDVLRTWVVDRLKLETAARQLGISVRQLTRERTRVLPLLTAALTSRLATVEEAQPAAPDAIAAEAPAAVASTYPFEPIPEITGFVARPTLARTVAAAMGASRAVHVHGGAGLGKTSLVAHLVTHMKPSRPILWHRFRPGVNDSLAAVVFELAQHLRRHGRARTAAALEAALPTPDVTLLTRLMLQDLADHPLVAVFDDAQWVEDNLSIRAFFEDAVTRLPMISVITVSRHEEPRPATSQPVEVSSLDREAAEALLTNLDGFVDDETAERVYTWTGGSPQLIRLAASWLRIASAEEIADGLRAFTQLDDVQAYLLDTLTGLIDRRDRDILDAASTFRTQFTDGVLSQVSGHSLAAVRDTGRQLVRNHIATRSRDGVAFVHESIRDYVYSRLPEERRCEFHSRAANWYAENGDLAEAAYHQIAAGMPVAEPSVGAVLVS